MHFLTHYLGLGHGSSTASRDAQTFLVPTAISPVHPDSASPNSTCLKHLINEVHRMDHRLMTSAGSSPCLKEWAQTSFRGGSFLPHVALLVVHTTRGTRTSHSSFCTFCVFNKIWQQRIRPLRPLCPKAVQSVLLNPHSIPVTHFCTNKNK